MYCNEVIYLACFREGVKKINFLGDGCPNPNVRNQILYLILDEIDTNPSFAVLDTLIIDPKKNILKFVIKANFYDILDPFTFFYVLSYCLICISL